MTDLFGIPLDQLTTILLSITIVILVAVVLLALGNLIFLKIGARNIPRRRTQMALIIFALMLSTTLITSVLATGDVITATVQTVAVTNLGNIDETVEGGHGPLGLFDQRLYYMLSSRYMGTTAAPDQGHTICLQAQAAQSEQRYICPHQQGSAVANGMAAALVEHDLLLADQTSRQVRSNVTSMGLIPDSEVGFGGLLDESNGEQHKISELAVNDVFLNHTLAILINAHAGDTLYLYSQRWPGQRYTMHVRAIVQDGGLVGQLPFLISNAETFQNIENAPSKINYIYVENQGGVDSSDQVTRALKQDLPPQARVHVIQVKQQGIQASQQAQNIFVRIFALFTLFALAIGLLLIFLIFVLLAAERRAEMGVARAIGVQRRHLIMMYVFEGTIYDLLASFVGLLVGIGLGAAIVAFLGPILANFNFPLKLTFQPRSLLLAYCLGTIFTFLSVSISAWLVSRMTVVDALRNLAESERPALTLRELWGNVVQMLMRANMTKRLRRLFFEQLPETVLGLIGLLARTGLLPIGAGYVLLRFGLEHVQITPFSLGLTLLIVGIGLMLKSLIDWFLKLIHRTAWQRINRRVFALLTGLTIMAYWALPFDVLAFLGLPRFQGGIEVFFVAAAMMVFGCIWALMANAEIFALPVLTMSRLRARTGLVARLATAYPLHHRFRTGLGITMFSLVIFAMTVMAVITSAMQNNYTNIDVQTGGYDIQAVAYFRPVPDIGKQLATHGIPAQAFSEIGSSITTELGVIQPGADNPAWRLYPAQIISGSLLTGQGLHLVARAQGFASDSAIWQALQTHPDYALIDNSALPYREGSLGNAPVYDPNSPDPNAAGLPTTPPGLNPYYTFSLSGIYQGDTTFAPTPIWTLGLQDSTALPTTYNPSAPEQNASGDSGAISASMLENVKATHLTIIGVVDNSDSTHFGLYIPQTAYPHVQASNDLPNQQSYYFKIAPGEDKHALALQLGSAFLDNGLETTVLEDEVWSLRGPRILLSDVLLGVVGLTLLLGVAALAITGTRAVIERRQQIGMLRALGVSRRLIQRAFLWESFFVGIGGSLIGVILGLILAHNIFAVNFFEQFHTGLIFSIPWSELGLIVAIALVASLLAALLPAWQAGRIPPVEALRS